MKLTEIKEQDQKAWDEFRSKSKFDKNVYRKNLFDLSEILNNFEVPFCLAFGTLLGAIRDKDFIDGDPDVDIMIMERNEEMLVQALLSDSLKACGLEVVRADQWLASVAREQCYVDCYLFRPHDDGTSKCWSYWIETDRLEHPEWIGFLGKQFRIPKDPESYLSRIYGNWKVKADTHANS